MTRAAREALQWERLRATLAWATERVPFYAERLRGRAVRGLGELATLPFTRKSDLREHYPFGLFAVPRAELARLHASSGTKGKPTVVGYTAGDLDVWREVMARVLVAAGGPRGGGGPGVRLSRLRRLWAVGDRRAGRGRRVQGARGPAPGRRPLPARDHRPRHRRRAAARPRGRARPDDAHQARAPADPLSHGRRHDAHRRGVRLRADERADRAREGPLRRRADRQGREPLSLGGRGRPARRGRAGAPLPAARRPPHHAGAARGAGGAGAGGGRALRRLRRRAPRPRRPAPPERRRAGQSDRALGGADAGGTAHAAALRGQSGASRRETVDWTAGGPP